MDRILRREQRRVCCMHNGGDLAIIRSPLSVALGVFPIECRCGPLRRGGLALVDAKLALARGAKHDLPAGWCFECVAESPGVAVSADLLVVGVGQTVTHGSYSITLSRGVVAPAREGVPVAGLLDAVRGGGQCLP